ncbi:MAG TPA: thioredoxin-dependent thiol peroxidase [Candidatus Hydrogenedentes bacterium]|nr:thioredoxin-dependent thiol peroxidase [Candidatus Hydrogenedentota bacterium]
MVTPEKVSRVPEVGSQAPDFNLPSSRGENVSLGKFRGKIVVLYFYPKDNTPGCTIEANEFQAAMPAFEAVGAVVLGVSPDSVASHCKFAEKFGLNFHLLADEDHKIAEAYGAWVQKNMYGKVSWGIQRSTFLIDREGRVARVWPKVKAEGHAAEVLEAVRQLA